MRRVLLALAVLLLAPLEAGSAPTTVSGRMVTHGFPLRSPSSLPACTAADSCVLDCYATASAWECRTAAGATVPVTQGVGTTFVSTPWGYAAKITDNAHAPTVSNADMGAALGGLQAFYDGDHAVVSIGSPNSADGDSTHSAGMFDQSTSGSGGLQAYFPTGIAYCLSYSTLSGGYANRSITSSGQWGALICSITAAGANTIRIHGSEATATDANAVLAPPGPAYFGRGVSANSHVNGLLSRVRFFSKALSAAERATIERQAFGGVGAEGRELTMGRASTAWMEHADGSVVAYGSNLPRIRSDYGLLIEGTRTNLLTYSNDFSQAAWTKGQFGSTLPVVTVNAATAPDGTLTADRIDFGATVNENDYSIVGQLPAASASGTFAGSVYLRTVSGSGTLYLGIIRSGTGTNVKSTACSVTTTWSRCYVEGAVAAAGGSNLIMGPWSYDAAQPNAQPALSVYVWGAQLEAGFGATSVIPTGAVAVTRANENITGSVTGWPRYDATVCATLRWERDTRDRSASYLGNMLVDTLGAGSTQPGIQFWAWYEGGVGAFVDTATRSYTPAFPFDSRLCARRIYAKKFAIVGAAAAASTAATYLQAGHTTLRLGSYGGTSLPLNGYLRDLTVTP